MTCSIFIAFASAVTCLQAYRGVRFAMMTVNKSKEDAEGFWSSMKSARAIELWLLAYIPDGMLYFVCSAAGFWALGLLWRLALAAQLPGISLADSAMAIFLSVIALLGVTGQLPHLIREGKLPGFK